MNAKNLKTAVVMAAVSGLAWFSPGVWAQTATPAAAPQLSYSVQQVMKLEQAKVSDDTIITFINTAGNSYGLDADQIIWLRSQGVSGPVISAMLSQGRPGLTMPAPATPAPAPVLASAPQPEVQTVSQPAPTVTYIQSNPDPAYYYPQTYPPYYYSPYYNYPYYGYGLYAPVGVSIGFGWGGGWRGGGWHGGGYGGHGYGGHGGHR